MPEAAEHGATLIAVALGGVVATLSALAATLFEAYLNRSHRARDAQLLFRELLGILAVQLDLAIASQGRGEPYGAITVRMLQNVRRELDIYDRNREALYFLSDGAVRSKTHQTVMRLAFALDRVLDLTAEIAQPSPKSDIEGLKQSREEAFVFLQQNAQAIGNLAKALAPRGYPGLGAITRAPQ